MSGHLFAHFPTSQHGHRSRLPDTQPGRTLRFHGKNFRFTQIVMDERHHKNVVAKTLAVQIRQRFHCRNFPTVRSLKMYYGDGNVQYVQLTAHGQYRRFYMHGKLNKMMCSASMLCNLELATII